MPEKTPSLDVLRTFLAVYRSGSFTSAAHRLGVTQPTVTNHITHLEKTLGWPLFTRISGGVQPTAISHDMAANICDHLDSIERFFRADIIGTDTTRPLHLGGPQEFITSLLIPAIAPALHQLPALNITFGLPDTLTQQLHNGDLDIAILTTRPREKTITSWPLIDEEFLLIANPALQHHDIHNLPIISYSRDMPIIRRYWKTVFNQTIEREAAITLPNLLAVKTATIHGMGITVLPSYLIGEELRNGTLVTLDTPQFTPLNTLYLAIETARGNRTPSIHNAANLIRDAVVRYKATIDS